MLNALLLTATGVWLGAMLFFASVVAPTVFGTLEPSLAGQMIRRVFPRYYLFGLICLSIATLTSLYVPTGSPWITLAFTVLLGITWYARQILMPQIDEARDAMLARNETNSAEFDRLHKRSVQLNTTEMVVCVVLLYVLAT
jgi:putative copper export protein